VGVGCGIGVLLWVWGGDCRVIVTGGEGAGIVIDRHQMWL
jgi:hypothetical protein